MFKDDIQEATEAKEPFEFSYTKPWLDWYETIKVSILYNQYNYLTLERRYGSSWWLVGHIFNKQSDKWERVDVGQINNHDIKRLVEWARFTTKKGHTINILTEIRAIDGILNPIDEFLRIIQER